MLWGGRLWRNPDFLKLWGGQTISELGSEVTALALPTVALLQLHKGAFEVGIMLALQRLPFPLLGLFAGVWVDRVRRRPLMIMADVIRLVALASLPVAAITHHLTLLHVYVVSTLIGIGRVLFDIAYLAYLPSLVGSVDLVEGNAKMEVATTTAALGGPGLGGILIQLVGAAQAIALDALSFLVSAVSLAWIRAPETGSRAPGASPPPTSSILGDIAEGLRLVFGHPVLRSQLAILSVCTVGFHLVDPAIYVFAYHNLHLTPAVLGLVLLIEGAGGVLGASFAGAPAPRLGLGATLFWTQLAQAVAYLCIPLAALAAPVAVLGAAFFINGVFDTIFNVNQVSLRQALTPNRLLGRMNASFRTVFWGAWPLANLVGGLLAARIGPISTLLIGGGIATLGAAAIPLTPMGRLREHPTAAA
jgi:predicted MFS family arabinose efflux permease